MGYATLDNIADAYIPLLALAALISVLVPLKNSNESIHIIGYKAIRLFGVVVPVYGLMYLDEYFTIFPSIGLDYSTHTALSLALTCFLSWAYKRVRIYSTAFFVAYLLLMLYQQYHTISDMALTGVVVGVFVFMVLRDWRRQS